MTAIFKEAVRLGKTRHNPAESAQRLRVGSVEASSDDKENKDGEIGDEQVYSAEELNLLIENAEPGFSRTLILVGARGRTSGAMISRYLQAEIQKRRERNPESAG